MLKRLLNILPPRPSTAEPEQRQALLRYVVVLMVLPGTITATYYVFNWLIVGDPAAIGKILLSLCAHPFMAVCYALVRRERLYAAYCVPPLFGLLAATASVWFFGPSISAMLLFVLSIVISGLLLGLAQAMGALLFSIAAYSGLGWLANRQASDPLPLATLITQDAALTASGAIILLAMIIIDRRNAQRLRREKLEIEQRMIQQSAALRVNEQRLRAMFQGMPVPTFAWRCIDEDMVLVDFNKAAEDQTRGGVVHCVGVRASEHYADRPDIIDDLQRCCAEKVQFTREMTYTFKHQPRSCELRATYAFVEPDTVLIHTEDITQTRQAQDALAESERRMRNLLSSIPGMSYRCLNDDKWTMTFASDGCLALTGYTADELIGNRRVAFADLVHPSDLMRIQTSPGSQGARDGEYTVTYRIRSADGETKWVWDQGLYIRDQEGNEIAQEGLILDISETHRAQSDLRASEARNRLLVEAFPDGIIVTDRDVVIVNANAAAVAMFGALTEDDLIGRSFYSLLTPHDRPRARYNASHGVGSAPSQAAEYSVMRADGTAFPIEVSAALVQDFEGHDEVFIIYARDISNRRHLQQQLQTALKLEAVGRLAGGIAHDFNNLLTVINGYANFLADAHDDDDPRKNDAREVLAAGRRAADLTRQLLAFSRRQVMQTEIMNVNNIVEDIEPMLRSLVGERGTIVCQLARDLPNVKLDRAQVERSITNLVTNGRDAMPNGGEIRITTRATHLHEPVESIPDDIPAGDYVVLSVDDSGTGMTETVLERALEPFYTTKEVGQGTGLGLSMVYGTIRQLDGALRIESEPGQGTSVLIYLPVSVDQVNENAADAQEPLLLRGAETILIVEDEDIVREYVARALAQLGYNILTAPDGPSAIKLFGDTSPPIDLLLLDVVMPGMSGPDLASRISALQTVPHTLFMSGHSAQTIHHMDLDVPEDCLIRKPFSPIDLARRVRLVLDS